MKRILEILKKNLISVICGVLAVAAVVLSFYPTASWYDNPTAVPGQTTGLVQELNAEVQKATAIVTLKNKDRTLPLLGPTGEPAPLKHFPNKDIIEKAKGYFADMKANCDTLKLDFDKLNSHDLLVPETLPNPDTNARVKFREAYLAGKAAPSTVVLAGMLNSGWPLSSAEIAAADDTEKKNNYDSQVHLVNGKPDPDDVKRVEKAWSLAKPQFELGKQVDVASHQSIYVNPTMLNNALIYGRPTETPSAYAIWTAQLENWIEQDIANGIIHADTDPGTNQIPPDIRQAAVKQWVSLTIPATIHAFGAAPGDANPSNPLGDAPNLSITGRACNGMYDVVHVTIQLDIDESRIQQVLCNLTAHQLLTVTHVDVTPLDGPKLLMDNFIYGTQPCVRLTIDLEDLFMRSWIDKYKPAGVNTAINGGKEPTAADAP
jgi:hypothetical protein